MCSQGKTWWTRRSHCSQAPTSRCRLWSWIWVSQRPLAQECESLRCWLWNAFWTDSSPEMGNKYVKFSVIFGQNKNIKKKTKNKETNLSLKEVWCRVRFYKGIRMLLKTITVLRTYHALFVKEPGKNSDGHRYDNNNCQ